MSVAISLRRDFDAPRLRGLAKKTKNAPQARRLLALAAIYDGATRTEAAKIGGVGLQIIRDWVRRFNGRGPEGLLDGKSPGQHQQPDQHGNDEERAPGRHQAGLSELPVSPTGRPPSEGGMSGARWSLTAVPV
jgi:Winged helix-turn helix